MFNTSFSMNVDEAILKLPHLGLTSKELLPEKPGIYYVVDELSIIWYIGKAKNLRNRWAGDAHHRFEQLKRQRKKQFLLYYEIIPESQLDSIERQRIEKYDPHLNGSRVKTKELRPSETLLRETLTILAPYSFILGVEPPREQDPEFVLRFSQWADKWRNKKSLLSLPFIHICIDVNALQEFFQDRAAVIQFIKKAFRNRGNYYDKWQCIEELGNYKRTLISQRLLVNGFAIELHEVEKEVLSLIENYNTSQLVNVHLRCIWEHDLEKIKNKCYLTVTGLSIIGTDAYYMEFKTASIKRISAYKDDLMKLVFNEKIDIKRLLELQPKVKYSEEINSGLPTRLQSLSLKKQYLKTLLIKLGRDLSQYKVLEYLEQLPQDENFRDSHYYKKITLYIRSFSYPDLRQPEHYSSIIYGTNGQAFQLNNLAKIPYQVVYLSASVDSSFWLLLEPYLADFAKVKLEDGEGWIEKMHVSARKFLVPAKLTITLNGKWKADIPFGPKDGLSYKETIDIISNRLQESGIPQLKFSFQSESTRS